jgi:hypothetical protein
VWYDNQQLSATLGIDVVHVCGSTKPCRKTIFMAWWHFHLQQSISAQVVL